MARNRRAQLRPAQVAAHARTETTETRASPHDTGIFKAIIDQLAMAVFVVDADGNIHYQNRAASRHIQGGTVLQIQCRRLAAYQQATESKLRAAIREAAAGAHDLGGIALADSDGGGIVAHISRADGHDTATGQPLVFVMFVDPLERRRSFGVPFGELFDLTPAEVNVVEALVSGARKTEIAGAMGNSEATVSTHLRRVFMKTDTSRQPALVRLFLNSVPPVLPRPAGPEAPADQPALDGER